MSVTPKNKTEDVATIQDEDFGVPAAPGTPIRPEDKFSEHPKVTLCARCGVTGPDPAAKDEKNGLVELIIANNLSLVCLIWTEGREEMSREPRSWKQAGNFITVWLPAILIAAVFVVAGFIGAAVLLGWVFVAWLVAYSIAVGVTIIRGVRQRVKKTTPEAS